MKTAYFHCSSGISGDMCLGALINGGADFNILKQQLSLLPLDNYEITYNKVLKNGISVGKFNVSYHDNHPHRHLSDIIGIINNSSLAPEIKKKSIDIFTCLANAEAKIHGTTPEKIHFHEVGAVDAIIDIVGTVICLSLLKVGKIISSPLPMGHGFITCAHGMLPLPAPATREILKGIPQYGIDIEGELVTPTGAAIIATLAHSFGQLPEMKIDAYGYGAGTKEYSIPNILSVSLGDSSSKSQLINEEVTVVETSLDDMNPEIFSYLWEIIFTSGALDMYITPIYMKKGRPGSLITVLCQTENIDTIVNTLLKETSSLGVRIHKESRRCCHRKKLTVQTKFGAIGVKIGFLDGIANLAPEYNDCQNIAKMHRVPLKEVYFEALAEAKKMLSV
ncbi:MAG: nickel pincer cofactor biosynthesis protein LarC [Dehalobacterium sp.]